jgi:hypothetical protein
MTPPFSLRSTPRFERLAQKLRRGHPDLRPLLDRTGEILQADPYNRSRQYHIKKLEGVAQGDGQYRLSLGRWRFRYDRSIRFIRTLQGHDLRKGSAVSLPKSGGARTQLEAEGQKYAGLLSAGYAL